MRPTLLYSDYVRRHLFSDPNTFEMTLPLGYFTLNSVFRAFLAGSDVWPCYFRKIIVRKLIKIDT